MKEISAKKGPGKVEWLTITYQLYLKSTLKTTTGNKVLHRGINKAMNTYEKHNANKVFQQINQE